MKMTENTQRQVGITNPYNARKEWEDEGKTGKEFQSADDSMAYVPKKKYAVMDKMEGKQNQEEVVETQKDEPVDPEPNKYQKVDYKKRYDDLKRHYDRKVNEWKDNERTLKEQLRNNRPTYTPPKTAEELAKFREENPDIFDVVESVSHMRSTEQMKDLQDELKEVKERLMYEEAKRAYVELKSLVPDYEQIKSDPSFHDWAEQQPKEIQDWIYNNRTNVQLAVQAINLYKASTGVGQRPPNVNHQSDNRGSAADAIPTRAQRAEPESGERIWKRSEIKRLSPQQFEKFEDEIQLAFREGRIVDG